MSDYNERKLQLQDQMRRSSGVRLEKGTASNLFRVREATSQAPLRVRDFNHVLVVNTQEGWAEVEGMTTYEAFVDETLRHGYMPSVVPQLKTITIGGAVAGVGIEATSFRYGLVHETVMEMEILLANGDTIICSEQENQDLFRGFPNSYGTLGYALRLKVKIIPVKPFVKIKHTHYATTASYFDAIEKMCADPGEKSGPDFVDGAMFGPTDLFMTAGTFVDHAPYVSDYTYLNIYYQSIPQKNEDYLSVRDFIWRWDTDWFWCSKFFGAENPAIRRVLGKQRLNSATYWKMKKFADRHPVLPWVTRGFSRRESVIQDVDIPIENAPDFAAFFFREINILPTWICPFRTYDPKKKFTFYFFDPKKLYINFGFWDSVVSDKEPGYYNRMIESKVTELEGKKGLYSDSYYTRQEFWNIYDKGAYDALKQKYDPQKKLKDIFEKCVERK